MRAFTHKNTWILGALLTASSVIAENGPSDLAQNEPSLLSKYDAPQTKPNCKAPPSLNICDSWNVFLTGSFIYWNPSQDNMEMGIINDSSNSLYAINGNIVNLKCDYKPGFKVGIGMRLDRDSWNTKLEYTWFRGDHHTNISISTTGNKSLFPKWEFPDYQVDYYIGKEKWRLHMDLLDLELSREYCVTPSISYCMFFGTRGAWIRQRLNVDYINETTDWWLRQNVYVTSNTNSWAVGPRAELHTNWLLGKGFKLYGNGACDILFTRYTHLRFKQQGTSAAGVVYNGYLYSIRQKNLNYLRGHLELEFGFDWGTYFCKNAAHVDLLAGYGFQIFFDQNMFRNFVDDQARAVSLAPTGNLYIHGLTASLRFDF